MKSTICWISFWVNASLNGGIPPPPFSICAWMAAFERIRQRPCERSGPTAPPPAPKLWHVEQPCDEISAAPAGESKSGFPVMFEPVTTAPARHRLRS